MTELERWKKRPMSFRLGRALVELNPPTTIWEMAAEVHSEYGEDLKESDLPAPLRNLVERMERTLKDD
jgi:hypothetical protein